VLFFFKERKLAMEINLGFILRIAANRMLFLRIRMSTVWGFTNLTSWMAPPLHQPRCLSCSKENSEVGEGQK
jgi:hypothetical protein